MKNFYEEFKTFAIKGNMIDMAIGIIIGTAFNDVVNVMVKEVFMPPLAWLTEGVNWKNKKFVLQEANDSYPESIAIGYGQLIESFVDFIIIAFAVFMVVKLMNRLRHKAEDTEDKSVATPKDIELLQQMKDLMEKQNDILAKKQS